MSKHDLNEITIRGTVKDCFPCRTRGGAPYFVFTLQCWTDLIRVRGQADVELHRGERVEVVGSVGSTRRLTEYGYETGWEVVAREIWFAEGAARTTRVPPGRREPFVRPTASLPRAARWLLAKMKTRFFEART